MANKYYGIIGFVDTENQEETSPGIWAPKITERKYYIDILSSSRRRDTSDKVNDDFQINNRFSILMDPFANENFRTIAYISYLGIKWKITNAEIQYPRLMLTVGGEYNNA